MMKSIKRNIVGAFIFSADNKLLLGHSKKGGVYPGLWIVPGGGVNDGETLKKALIREILEETNIDISNAEITEQNYLQHRKTEKTLRETGEKVVVDMAFHDHVVKLPKTANQYELKFEDDFHNGQWFDLSELKNLDHAPPGVFSLKKLGLL